MKYLLVSMFIVSSLNLFAQDKIYHSKYTGIVYQTDLPAKDSSQKILNKIAESMIQMKFEYQIFENNSFIYAEGFLSNTSAPGLNFIGHSSEEVLVDKKNHIIYNLSGKLAQKAETDSVQMGDHPDNKWSLKKNQGITLFTSDSLPLQITPVVLINGLSKGIRQIVAGNYVITLDEFREGTFNFQSKLNEAKKICIMQTTYKSLL